MLVVQNTEATDVYPNKMALSREDLHEKVPKFFSSLFAKQGTVYQPENPLSEVPSDNPLESPSCCLFHQWPSERRELFPPSSIHRG